ncbi:HPr family phosphocarrier protein [Salipaludibacillus sp. LMS25]|jgi:phosphocarrier protein|uniref:HPr family phosphocarrier protein n=1 Tax=Salipaludibacillus sp. LMS25 TaxID=2924031 RepID=UPI0020D1EB98|nr:HPr family phosphocarrier protein [Salipaludibacillus sp. LMS25]UTR14300.1 HPr family phosphocarrier protein [Salipaludibacillus sp. LMS25]
MKLTVKKPIFAESASFFVNQASQVSGKVIIKKDHWVIDAKSLLGVLALSLQPGQEIDLEVDESESDQFLKIITEEGLVEK